MVVNRRVVVAISGGGRTLANLITQQESFGFEVVGVIASRKDCAGLQFVDEAKLPVLIGDFGSDPGIGRRITGFIRACDGRWVALAGFLKKFPLLPDFQGRVVNIHPALLPNYGGPGMYGTHVHAAVCASADRVSGATVHLVNERYDDGQILAQSRVPVPPGRDPAELANGVFEAECWLYPRALQKLIAGELPSRDGVVYFDLPAHQGGVESE